MGQDGSISVLFVRYERRRAMTIQVFCTQGSIMTQSGRHKQSSGDLDAGLKLKHGVWTLIKQQLCQRVPSPHRLELKLYDCLITMYSVECFAILSLSL